MVSIVIPSRNERFLAPTIKDLLKNAKGDIQIIAVLDGYWPPSEEIINDKRVNYIHKGSPEGMRQGINSAAAIATGEYLMKIDGHCMVSPGFDLELAKNCKPNWVVIPRRKRLDAENWQVQIQENPKAKPDIDYEYLSYPDDPADFGGPGLNGRIWTERILERQNKPEFAIDKDMSFQGSCWFMPLAHFKACGFMDHQNWGPFWNEAQEMSFRSVLCKDGQVMINKNVWYAHLHKGKKYGRGYRLDESALTMGRNMAMKFFAGERVWEDQKYPLSFLIEQFMPIPGWDAKKVEELKQREKDHGWNV